MTIALRGKVEKNDPMLVLHNETGQFHVTGPSGQKELWQLGNGKVLAVTFIETTAPREGLYMIEKIANEPDKEIAARAGGNPR